MVAANRGDVTSYGATRWTERVTRQMRDAFGAGAARSCLQRHRGERAGDQPDAPPVRGGDLCGGAHLNVDECGAAERILGSKLLAVPTPDGKLTPDLVATRLAGRGDEHRAQPRVGRDHPGDRGRHLLHAGANCGRSASSAGPSELLLYMDGARLANAAAFLGCPLADLAVQRWTC